MNKLLLQIGVRNTKAANERAEKVDDEPTSRAGASLRLSSPARYSHEQQKHRNHDARRGDESQPAEHILFEVRSRHVFSY